MTRLQKLITPTGDTSLEDWRHWTFLVIIVLTIVIGLINALTARPWLIGDFKPWEIILYSVIFFLAIYLTFSKRTKTLIKYWIASSIFYMMAIMTFLGAGLISTMEIWIFCFVWISTLLLGIRAGLISVIISVLTLAILGLGIRLDLFYWDITMEIVQKQWAMNSIILVFLSIGTVISLGLALKIFEQLLTKEQSLVEKLQEANQLLEKEIAQRKVAEATLQEYNERLEDVVSQRTDELEVTQKELLQKEKLATLGKLAGAVAHEIRHPLGVINNVIFYLNMQTSEVKNETHNLVVDYLDIISAETKVAEQIISAMLEYDREETPHATKVSPTRIVEAVLEDAPPPENISSGVSRMVP